MLSIRSKSILFLLTSLILPLAEKSSGTGLPAEGESILSPTWFTAIPKKQNGAEFKLLKTTSGHSIVQVSTKRNITARKPDNYPFYIKLSKQFLKPGSTVAIRFLYRGRHSSSKIEAFHTAPIMSVKASYTAKMLLNSRTNGRLELFPFWSEFKTSFTIPADAVAAKPAKRRRRRTPPPGLSVVLFFGYMPEEIEITRMDIRCYPAQTLAPDALVAPKAAGNSLIVFQNHSKTIDVLWNDSHPAKRPMHVSSVRQPKFGHVTFDNRHITYTSTKPHILGYDYFYYTVSDNLGNSRTAPVKVIVTPDFLDGSWNLGHDYNAFPNDLSSDKGTPIYMRRFVKPYAMSVGVARVIRHLEDLDEKGQLACPLKMAVFPFAKRGPNGENMQPCGICWDLPHSIDSSFCLPIMHTMGCVVNQTFKGPHNHDIRSFRMKFSVKQRCINTSDRKVRFFFKTHDNDGDIGTEYRMFSLDKSDLTKKGRPEKGPAIIEIGGHLYRTSFNKAAITCQDIDGDGFPDKWFDKNGAPLKSGDGGRLAAPVKDIENISVDFDMKDYFDWCEQHGWMGGGHISYLFNGSEMGSANASGGRMKGAGIMLFDNLDYWLSTDIPAKHPMPDIELSNSSKGIIIKLDRIFDRIYAENLDGSIPKLRYKTEQMSVGNILKAVIRGRNLVLIPVKGKLGKVTLTIKAIDDGWHWDDIERFDVTLVNKTGIDNDHDGLSDEYETRKTRTNPIFADSDFDGLSDREEIAKYKTAPMNPDSDNDGLNDGDEIKAETDPLRNDSDGDGLSDGDEIHKYKCDPLKKDSDGDGYSDGYEAKYGMDPGTPYKIFAQYNFDKMNRPIITDISGQEHNLHAHRRLKLRNSLHNKALACDGAHSATFSQKDETTENSSGYTLAFRINPGNNKTLSAIFTTPNFSILSDSKSYFYYGNPPQGTRRRWAGRGPHSRPAAKVKYAIAPCQPGKWTHIAIVSNGKNTAVLINGTLKKILKGMSNGGFSRFMIGGDINRKYHGWNGLIDDLLIAPKPYSNNKIKQLIQQQP
jgi:hypothetical protein